MRKALLLLLVFGGCTAIHRDGSSRYVHVVILWLKHPGDLHDRQTLIDTSQNFVGKIPGLISVCTGSVVPSTRPVVDSSYDVGVIMTFDSDEALQKYPKTPVHQRAMKEVLGPLVDHYRVYDFVDTKMAKGRPPE